MTHRTDEPAFPLYNPQQGSNYGMTLRDYFAAQALAGMGVWWPKVIGDHVARAVWAYAAADAMLHVRAGEHLHKEPTQ